ncbi:MAG: tetratricopeptide repeat protein, partial [Fimbriimonadales bacterium]|nr:tetratricopeptide repeat protein [Fimbriimonadales bacterium]
NLYFREERASGGESWSAGGWEFGVASGNGDRPPFIPRPEAVMFAAEPTAQRRAEARLWLNAASEPIRFTFELPAALPRPAPAASVPQLPQMQQVGALTVEFRGLNFADYTIGDRLGTFLAPDIRILHAGKPLTGWDSLLFDLVTAGSPDKSFALGLPSADAPAWTVRLYINCYDINKLVQDAFSDYFDVTVAAPRSRQVVPIQRALQIEGAQLKVLALVGAGVLRYRVGEPLPRRAEPLPSGATTQYQLSPREAHIVSSQPYLLCELTLPLRADRSGGASWGYLSFHAGAGEQVLLLAQGENTRGESVRIDHNTAMTHLMEQLDASHSLIAIPLEPDGVSGRLKMRLGLHRTRRMEFQIPPLEAARVARSVQNALAWREAGDMQQFKATMRDCLRQYRQSKDPATLTYLGLLCTAAELPPEEFQPLIAPLKSLTQKEPKVFAYRIALGAALTRMGRPQEALSLLQELNPRHSSDALALMWYALALVEAGRREEAKRLIQSHQLQHWRSVREIDDDKLRSEIIGLLGEEYERRQAGH